MERLGALAAFGTAACWSLSAIFFENASRRAGALAVNFWKVVFALGLLAIAGTLLRGMPLPLDATPRAWLLLSISGVIGFLISDYFLFNAYLMIGSRTTVVFQAITPLFTAILAYAFLGERMRTSSLAAMFVVVTGILTVVISRRPGNGNASAKDESGVASTPRPAASLVAKGSLFAFLSTVFQAAGLLFSKAGLGSYDAVSGTQIRVITAIFGFALQAFILGKRREVFTEPRRQPKVLQNIAAGAVFGPFLGVTFSLFALQNTDAGTASTLMALTPVLIIPPTILILKQKVRPMEIIGAAIASAGTALFFML